MIRKEDAHLDHELQFLWLKLLQTSVSEHVRDWSAALAVPYFLRQKTMIYINIYRRLHRWIFKRTYDLSWYIRSWSRSNGSAASSSLYGCGSFSNMNVMNTIVPTMMCNTIMNRTAFRKPTESYSNPLVDGPINAPSAKNDVHKPETRPYVSILSGKPWRLLATKTKTLERKKR